LSSSDTTELEVPTTATIPAGSASITIPVVVQDDSILDGTMVVMLSANTAGYRGNSNSVSVLDVESLQLIVDRSALVEKSPVDSTRATVKLSFPAPVGGYLVQLTPSINGQLSLPGSVLVPQGSQSIDFELAAIDDYGVEGAMSLELLATGTSVSSAAVDLLIEDNDEPLWQNPLDKWDTDNNLVFNAMDALTIINNLNRYGTRYLRPGIDLSSPPYVDTNGDGIVNAIDALMVINELNRRFSA
jgi:hypothetical protein